MMLHITSLFKPNLSQVDIINYLESDDTEKHTLAFHTINNRWGRLPVEKHGNSYLLYAIAWGQTKAALRIIEKSHGASVDLQDSYVASKSSALILACKTDAAEVAQRLIECGADVNLQDYRGYTALHYAYMMRNTTLVKLLLSHQADSSLEDVHNKEPSFYEGEIYAEQLAYPYGYFKAERCLQIAADWGDNYQGTMDVRYSALRWFLPHIIVNNNWGKDIKIRADENMSYFYMYIPGNAKKKAIQPYKTSSLYGWAKHHLYIREPVMDARLYQMMLDCLIKNRNNRPLFSKHKEDEYTHSIPSLSASH